jgi:hypothetical protein
MTLTYRAEQTDTTRCRAWIDDAGRRRALRGVVWSAAKRRYVQGPLDVAYGYGGSGPTALARAVLGHALGLVRLNTMPHAEALIQDFKWSDIAPAPQDAPLAIPLQRVLDFVAAHPRASELEEDTA